ncbi:YggT family protein [Tessaracoccus antarcticus]|uniref:YggT family protein n=1 Tax=Tessaracoccus antarcticus TaxID=2479848 RepID=A0A3M0GEV7_9ACTN|nr:YggT family protein [Tessaracoccus antarcticus]RMB59699.1 YggT family protein [Tessaracoccus antarcticus]
MIGFLLFLLLRLYLLVLFGRIVLSWVPSFAPGWQPRGPVLVVTEGIYWATDPPLTWLRRVFRPVRLGGVALDLSVMLLFLGVQLAASMARLLPV